MLLGGPGSGKGTQATRLAAVLRVPHISTGDLFRDHMDEATPLGLRAARYVAAGDLVPDDITRSMVRDRLRSVDAERGFILDGYPRTRLQANFLDALLRQLHRQLSAAVHIRVSDGELFSRLTLRRREDDQLRTIRNRLRTFHRYNNDLVDYYRGTGLLHEIDGEGEPDEVFARLIGIFRGRAGFTTI